ncbi:TonB-dependent receptor plug domain-containing protein [Roseobacter sp. HKCCA2468]|uniref:TonB-dependent receptor plug domain-containing protein n=1 Tax=Roseobacter sp. HKCCA2468 TaxID=3120342 RepID=UPI0030EDE6BD
MRPSSTLSLAALCAGLAATPLAAQNVFTLDELVFSASLTDVARDRTGVRVSRLTARDLANGGRLQFSEFLETLAGVNVTQSGPIGTSATLRIRGLDSKYIPVRINGIDVTDPSSTQTQFDFGKLTSSGIASAEVLYGSQSAILGSGAIGGAVNITTVDAPDEIGSEIGYNLEVGSFETMRTGLTYGTRFERGFLAVSLSNTNTEGYSAADENAGNAEADGFESTDLNLRGEYQATDTLTFGASVLAQNANFEFDASGGVGGDAARFSEYELLAARLFALADFGSSTHEFGIEASRTTRTDPSAPAGRRFLFEGQREKLTYLGVQSLDNGDTISFGAEAMTERYFSTDNTSPIHADYESNSVFTEWLTSPLTDLDISISARLTDNSHYGSKTTGRVAIAWQAGPSSLLRASLSTGFRAPSLNELYGPFGANAALQPETSQSAEIGFEHVIGRVTFEAGLFQTRITDLIQYTTGYNQVPGTSRTDGYQLGLSYIFLNDAGIDLNYTSTDARAADGARLARVPRHDVSLSASTPLGQRTTAGLSLQSVSDRLDTTTPLEDYTVLNANLTYTLANGADLFMRIDNLTDEQYQTTRGYGASDRAFYIGVRGTF